MLELLREHDIGDKIEKKVSGTEEIMHRDSYIDIWFTEKVVFRSSQ